jgi:cytochrome c1
VALRLYIAGLLINTPENMVAWIRHPQAVKPLTAMPDLGVPENDARDMTAYLYSHR